MAGEIETGFIVMTSGNQYLAGSRIRERQGDPPHSGNLGAENGLGFNRCPASPVKAVPGMSGTSNGAGRGYLGLGWDLLRPLMFA